MLQNVTEAQQLRRNETQEDEAATAVGKCEPSHSRLDNLPGYLARHGNDSAATFAAELDIDGLASKRTLRGNCGYSPLTA